MSRVTLLMFCVTVFITSNFSYANDDPAFSERVRANGIVSETESILLSSNVYFYPNKKGFGLLSGGNKRAKGYIVFTENGFSVATWSRKEKAYVILHQEAYTELASTSVAGNSPFLRLVTESKATGKFNSYEILDGKNAVTPNVVKTKEAQKLVVAGIKGFDVKNAASASDLSTVEIANQKQRMQELEERIARLERDVGKTSVKQEGPECDCKCPQN